MSSAGAVGGAVAAITAGASNSDYNYFSSSTLVAFFAIILAIISFAIFVIILDKFIWSKKK